jgi:hypothetical protein
MNAFEVFAVIAVAFVGGVLSLWVAVYTGKIELKKRRPETITHECRLIHLQVYTFIKGDKKQTPPLCPYIDPSDYITCQFDPGEDRTDALRMKEINKGKCYVAQFTDKFDLI